MNNIIKLLGLLYIIFLIILHAMYLSTLRGAFAVGGEWFVYTAALYLYIASWIKRYIDRK